MLNSFFIKGIFAGILISCILSLSVGQSFAIDSNITNKIYDEKGQEISENEIVKYTNPDRFTNAFITLGVITSLIVRGSIYPNIEMLGYTLVGGIVGNAIGVAMNNIFPTKALSRDDAISTIKKERTNLHKGIVNN